MALFILFFRETGSRSVFVVFGRAGDSGDGSLRHVRCSRYVYSLLVRQYLVQNFAVTKEKNRECTYDDGQHDEDSIKHHMERVTDESLGFVRKRTPCVCQRHKKHCEWKRPRENC